MEQKNYPMHEKGGESEILFSKSVKAGKRIYYIDVKKDRKGELYLSMTESKRLKDQGDALHPVFEKHKIFLYREDLEKFQTAFAEAAAYTQEHAPEPAYTSDWGGPSADFEPADDAADKEFKLELDF